MKVLLLSSEFPPGPGGIGTHAWHLALQLHRRGWQVEVIAAQDYVTPMEAEAFRRAQPFTVVSWRSRGGLVRNAISRWKTLRSAVRRDPPSVVVASGQRSTWMAALGLPRGISWTAIGHATEFGVGHSWQCRLTRWSFEQARSAVFVSQFTQGYAARAGVRPKRSVIIPNGADADTFRVLPAEQVEAFRRRETLGDRPVILTVGNVTVRKGQEVMIRALPSIRNAVPNVLYAMVGLPTLREPLQALARSLGVDDLIRFVGRVDPAALVNWMNACTLFAMTSRTTANGDAEGFGIAAVEAALCGKAAVVSDGSGLPEAILPGETGIVVPQNDPEATAAASVSLLADPVRLCAMGSRALNRARTEQTWEKRGTEYDRHFRSHLLPESLSP